LRTIFIKNDLFTGLAIMNYLGALSSERRLVKLMKLGIDEATAKALLKFHPGSFSEKPLKKWTSADLTYFLKKISLETYFTNQGYRNFRELTKALLEIELLNDEEKLCKIQPMFQTTPEAQNAVNQSGNRNRIFKRSQEYLLKNGLGAGIDIFNFFAGLNHEERVAKLMSLGRVFDRNIAEALSQLYEEGLKEKDVEIPVTNSVQDNSETPLAIWPQNPIKSLQHWTQEEVVFFIKFKLLENALKSKGYEFSKRKVKDASKSEDIQKVLMELGVSEANADIILENFNRTCRKHFNVLSKEGLFTGKDIVLYLHEIKDRKLWAAKIKSLYILFDNDIAQQLAKLCPDKYEETSDTSLQQSEDSPQTSTTSTTSITSSFTTSITSSLSASSSKDNEEKIKPIRVVKFNRTVSNLFGERRAMSESGPRFNFLSSNRVGK